MNVSAKVLAIKSENGQLLAKLCFDGRLPKVGEIVTVRWGSQRSQCQNALYWLYLEWCMDHGLRDKGHFSREALHDNLKAHFNVKSTAVLNKLEFGKFFEQIDMFICDFFEMDTTPFWKEYEKTWAM